MGKVDNQESIGYCTGPGTRSAQLYCNECKISRRFEGHVAHLQGVRTNLLNW